jgi:hypothetical protein
MLARIASEKLLVSRCLMSSCFALSVLSLSLMGQENTAAPAVPGIREFPVILQQSVIAGKSSVGTRVRAKLEIATLVDGIVFPRNAELAGEIIESSPKTATDPSHLAIRIDSIQWKKRSAAIKVYLTAWYYPTITESGQNLQYGPPQSPTRTWNGQGAYPNSTGSYKPFPSSDSTSDNNAAPETSSTKLSNHPVLMKDAEASRSSDGNLELISARANIKLDRLTTYVFADSDPAMKK